MTISRHFARHIVSWYPGVHVDAVARAERVEPAVVRAARLQLNRGSEYGGTHEDTLLDRPAGGREGQMSFAELEVLMRSNRSRC